MRVGVLAFRDRGLREPAKQRTESFLTLNWIESRDAERSYASSASIHASFEGLSSHLECH